MVTRRAYVRAREICAYNIRTPADQVYIMRAYVRDFAVTFVTFVTTQ